MLVSIFLLGSPQNLTLTKLLNIEKGIKIIFTITVIILQIPIRINQKIKPKVAKKANKISGPIKIN
tara:strand:+ start:248 stop:445 length:198 start_codon:yes stop_codon:yes gene_type:complete